MNIEEFRNYCLMLGDVTEKTPFGKFARRFDSILAFYVEAHMFCFIDMDNFTFVNLRSTPDEIETLQSTRHSVGHPLNPSMRYWVQIEFNGDVTDNEIRSLVAQAYDIVKSIHAPRPSSSAPTKTKQKK